MQDRDRTPRAAPPSRYPQYGSPLPVHPLRSSRSRAPDWPSRAAVASSCTVLNHSSRGASPGRQLCERHCPRRRAEKHAFSGARDLARLRSPHLHRAKTHYLHSALASYLRGVRTSSKPSAGGVDQIRASATIREQGNGGSASWLLAAASAGSGNGFGYWSGICPSGRTRVSIRGLTATTRPDRGADGSEFAPALKSAATAPIRPT